MNLTQYRGPSAYTRHFRHHNAWLNILIQRDLLDPQIALHIAFISLHPRLAMYNHIMVN